MDAHWFMAWVTNTAWVAFFPVVFLVSLFGWSNGMAAEMISNIPLSDVTGPGSVFPKLLLGTVVVFFMYAVLPFVFLGAYILCAVSLTNLPGWDAGARGVNIILAAIIGGATGNWLTSHILNRIDNYFGLDNKLACGINAWAIVGGVYMAIKAAKVGKSIITKI